MRSPKSTTFIAVAAFCLAYFLAMAVPNALGAKSESMLSVTSVDEPVTYPHVVRMLTPASGPKDLFERWIIYGDYHYGYPFYFFSALAVLPIRLIHGALFTNFTALNLWLLRQLISVLPTLLAAALLVWMHTRFRKLWPSLLLLAAILSLRAVIRSAIQWWHPDALSLLAVVLTLFFLQRDDHRFGRNFILAAAACGFCTGIKLAGVWFFLAVPVYLLSGVIRKRLSLPRAALMAAAFVAVMSLALVVSNPFLYNSGARQEMIAIQTFKTEELSQGYSHDDPAAYVTGLESWRWTIETWYAGLPLLAFLALSLLIGCVYGPNKLLNRLILLWAIPYSVYLVWFVVVKPDHYWLPVMLPLFSTALNLPMAVQEGLIPWLRKPPYAKTVVNVLTAAILVIFIAINFARPYSGILAHYNEALRIEQTYSPRN